jgi:hypothetical protein
MAAHHTLPPAYFVTKQHAACVVEVQKDLKGRPLAWECQVGLTIVGAYVSRRGEVLCTIEGEWNRERSCWEYTVCGTAYEVCH